ncbi:uncharacterized protein TNCV_887611 [Trichonephila clavipes]|uniref:Uncharacterized protein n=1 Tax=Trichonephila clavipes TaxID=2585209 RepID=A0A8X6RCH3_TRICX|nr:uncharacterized protein TNCV_887611 [Trichonephila clavipes]
MTGTLPPLLDSVVGGGTPGRSCVARLWIQCCCALVTASYITQNSDETATHRLRSGDLIETISALQTKSFLLAKTFLDSPVSVSPHKSLNTCRGVISEPDLLTIPDAEILEGFSGQAVIQVRRITIKKDSTVIPKKHLILTFNTPNLPTTIKAGYLNCKIRPHTFRILCAALSARGSDIRKLHAVAN